MNNQEMLDKVATANRLLSEAQRELFQVQLALQRAATTPVELSAEIVKQEDLASRLNTAVERRANLEENKPFPIDDPAQRFEHAKTILKAELEQRGPAQARLIEALEKLKFEDVARRPVAMGSVVDLPDDDVPTVKARPTEKQDVEQAILDVLTRFLSAKEIHQGTGRLYRDGVHLKQYEDDILQVETNVLASWPSGFYTDHQSRASTFFVNTGSGTKWGLEGMALNFGKLA